MKNTHAKLLMLCLVYLAPLLPITAVASVDGTWSDEFFYNLRNFDADKFDSYFLLNARLSWLSADQRWELALIGHNLTDEAAGIQGFDLASLCGCNEVSYQPPRWYGFNVRLNL